MTLYAGGHQGKLPYYQVCCLRHSDNGDRVVLVCQVILQLDQRVIRLYGQERIKVSYHPAKFGVRKHSGSRDVFSLSHDLHAMPSFESNLVDSHDCQIW